MYLEFTAAGRQISTILKHDRKQNSYKIALLRAINDVVLAYPDLPTDHDIAIPLRLLADRWIAYYWPFADSEEPIYQGARRDGANDIAFRPELETLRAFWDQHQLNHAPSDGFWLVQDLTISRRRTTYSHELLRSYEAAQKKIVHALQQPIRYAGPSEYSVFQKPDTASELGPTVQRLPGSGEHELCLVVSQDLWDTFLHMSLWVEALCIHEWSLFTEGVRGNSIDRGEVYFLLTARPEERDNLFWERSQINNLMQSGYQFFCPWTSQPLYQTAYHVDHIIPLALYPTNELWNLVPAHPQQNIVKNDRLPSRKRMAQASDNIRTSFALYCLSEPLNTVLRTEVSRRFSSIPVNGDLPSQLTSTVEALVERLGEARNVARY
jgi:hypothetical protein